MATPIYINTTDTCSRDTVYPFCRLLKIIKLMNTGIIKGNMNDNHDEYAILTDDWQVELDDGVIAETIPLCELDDDISHQDDLGQDN